MQLVRQCFPHVRVVLQATSCVMLAALAFNTGTNKSQHSQAIGSQGLTTSMIGFGAMEITSVYNPPLADEAALALLDGIQALGVTFYDTSEIYKRDSANIIYEIPENQTSAWYNEQVLGYHFQKLPRRSYTIATKYMPSVHGGKCDFKTMAHALNASLTRLGVAYVDIYYLHRMPASVELLDECMTSLGRLVHLQKVKYVGLSEASPKWLKRAHAVHPVSVIQQEWSLLSRDLEEELVPTCVALGIGIVAYSPLARSLLTNPEAPRYRPQTSRFTADNWSINKALVVEIASLAAEKNATLAQLSLAWLYERARVLDVSLVAIAGTTNVKHMQDNMGFSKLRLSVADMAMLDGIADRVSGARGTAAYMSRSFEHTAY